MATPRPEPTFFRSAAELRRWLKAHHADTRELFIGFWKKDSGRGGITYREALDEALCFGWIDGVRKSAGPEAYVQRFTPRQAKSYWSAVNTRRMKELIAAGRVAKPGLAAFERRDASLTKKYSFERETAAFRPAEEKALRANARAWEYFQSRPPGYRRLCAFFVTSAKKDETRASRLQRLIDASARGEPIGPLKQSKKA